jgi:hypothetical protein
MLKINPNDYNDIWRGDGTSTVVVIFCVLWVIFAMLIIGEIRSKDYIANEFINGNKSEVYHIYHYKFGPIEFIKSEDFYSQGYEPKIEIFLETGDSFFIACANSGKLEANETDRYNFEREQLKTLISNKELLLNALTDCYNIFINKEQIMTRLLNEEREKSPEHTDGCDLYFEKFNINKDYRVENAIMTYEDSYCSSNDCKLSVDRECNIVSRYSIKN